MIVGLEDIFRIVAGLAFAGAHIFEHRLTIEAPRILLVKPVGDVGYSSNPVAGFKRDWRNTLKIDGGHLLAFPQVANGRLAQRRIDLEGDPWTGPAAIQPQHEPRLLRRATIDVRKDAQASTPAAQQRLVAPCIGESGPPHQRTVPKHPKAAMRIGGGPVHKRHGTGSSVSAARLPKSRAVVF